MKEILIIKPFNLTYIGLFLLFLAVFAGLAMLLKKKDLEVRKKTLLWTMAGGLIFYFWYKYMLSIDLPYSQLQQAAGEGAFSWWKELPIQLCNINLILVPVSILTGKRELQSFCFFLGPLGALMAILMPCTGFECYSLLLPRMLGYYLTHWLVFFGSISLCTFGIYRPKRSDLKRTTVTVIILSFAIFLFDMLLRLTGVCVNANYFYVVEPFGNPILEMLYKIIPIPYVYVLPTLAILIPYMLLVTAILEPKGKASEDQLKAGD